MEVRAQPDAPARPRQAGVVLAVTSAATFGSSGPMAKALMEAGWSAGAAVFVRLGGAAIVLTLAAAIAQRGRLRLRAASVRTLVIYGVVAMAGTQFAFFNAVRTLDVGVALLLEFMAPVILLAWTSARARRMPQSATLLGAVCTLVGLAFVLELGGTGGLDVVGVLWGILSALCLCAFFVFSERQDPDLPPVVMAAGGTAIGAMVIAVGAGFGVVPIAVTAADTVLAGVTVGWVVPAAWLVLVSTVAAYLSGIGAILRLGSRTASFTALSEVLFAVVVAWLLLAELPGLAQLVGGVCIVTGIVVIQRTEHPYDRSGRPRAVEEAHPV